MLTDANSNNLVQTKVHTVASCSDLQTGHLRLAAYNLAFFSLPGILFKLSFSSRKTTTQSPGLTVKDRNTRGQKSRSDYQTQTSLPLPIKSRSTGESLTCRALHRGGANSTFFSKNVNDFLQVFSDFFVNSSKSLIYQRFFRKIFFRFMRFYTLSIAIRPPKNDISPGKGRAACIHTHNYDAYSSCQMCDNGSIFSAWLFPCLLMVWRRCSQHSS